jgi:hypothetical protein
MFELKKDLICQFDTNISEVFPCANIDSFK